MKKQFFSWRSAILDSQELQATTKHVLLTLSCHMNDAGESCYPSIELLCRETGLSNRAVITHLHKANEAGWIEITRHGFGDTRYWRNEYKIKWPDVQDGSLFESTEQNRAHHIVANAIKDGRLKKQPCESCENPKAEAHHDDYSKPLEVRWLCRKCHRKYHRDSVNQVHQESVNVVHQGTENLSEPGSDLGERSDQTLVKEVHTNTSNNSPKSTPKPTTKKINGRKNGAHTLLLFINEQKSKGLKVIPDNHAVFKYAERMGIPTEMIHVAWYRFKHDHIDRDKKQKNWPQTFLVYVRKDYLRIWRMDPQHGFCYTNAGLQAKKAMELNAEADL